VFEDFESAPLGNFTNLSLAEMTVTLSGTGSDEQAGITNVVGDAILGYNTTGEGSKHLRFVPPFGAGTVTVTFTPNVKLQAWGAYFTGVGTVPNTSVEVGFDDGTAQTFAVPGASAGGATFFGFTDPEKIITSVTVREILTSTSTRDILSIDDVRFAPAGATRQHVPAGEAATVTVEEKCTTEPDGLCAVAGIDIPAGTFSEDVTVTVQFVKLAANQGCHDFLLGQFGRCLKITADQADGGGKAVLNNPVTVGLCLDAYHPLDLFKFEDRQGSVVALEQTTASFLNCSGFNLSSVESPNPLNRFATRLWRWLEPKPLMAAHTGFGGIVPGPKLSFFTWAAPIQISFAGLGVNVRRSGKDGFAVSGTFNMGAKDFGPNQGEQGFDPAAQAVTVGFGKYFQTIPSGSFKPRFGRFVYTAPLGTTTGVLGMEIRSDGGFTTSGAVPTEGGTLPAFRPFSLQIGHRTQGAGLKCGSDGKCVRQEP